MVFASPKPGSRVVLTLFSPWICCVFSARNCLNGMDMTPDYPLIRRTSADLKKLGNKAIHAVFPSVGHTPIVLSNSDRLDNVSNLLLPLHFSATEPIATAVFGAKHPCVRKVWDRYCTAFLFLRDRRIRRRRRRSLSYEFHEI